MKISVGTHLRRGGSSLLATLVACTLSTSTYAATPKQIDDSMQSAIKFLYNQQKDGHWELSPKRVASNRGDAIDGDQWGGRTALITYALLAAGESPNDPRLKRAIDFLRTAELVGYYAIGLRAQIWPYLPLQADLTKKGADADGLLLWAGIEKDMSKADGGLYDYTLNDRVRIDLSVSQYGVLGMWACTQANFEVPWGDPKKPNYWKMVETAWLRLQDKRSGGWAYQGGEGVSGSMTAAGIATLLITRDYLTEAGDVQCVGNAGSSREAAIAKAIAHLGTEIPKIFGEEEYPHRLYTIYGVERVGVASGHKFLGGHDWFAVGSDYLVAKQARDGSWHGGRGREDVGTAFGLLFLARGREPVMMNKLKYELSNRANSKVEGFWNQRSRDVPNATRFVSRETERGLNWQILDLAVATTRDLHDAPIAYISGAQSFTIDPAQLKVLREYVEEGGLLVFNVDCGRRQFSQSVTKMLVEQFGGEWRPLPDSHPIMRSQQFKASGWNKLPNVQALSNGVRELAILIDDDAGKSFQLNQTSRSDTRKPVPFELITNVYQYAIDKEHAAVKGRSHVVDRDPAIKPTSTIKLARLAYGTKDSRDKAFKPWDPEPAGWRRMQAILHNQERIDLQITPVELGPGDLGGYQAAHLTGVGAVKLNDQQAAQLKRFVEAGGVLIIDAAGGNSGFGTSIESQLGQIVANAEPSGGVVLAKEDPLFSVGGKPPAKVAYRTFAQATVGTLDAPRIRGTKVGNRYGILYSAEDLSAGLVGNQMDGIRGYTPATSVELMTRLLIYARNAGPGAAPSAPAPKP